MSQAGDYSSSDDESSNFQSNIQIPAFDVSRQKKPPNSGRNRNFVKAQKKLKSGGKSVRFPDLSSVETIPRRHSMLSASSARNSSDLDLLIQEIDAPIDPNLPSFVNMQPMKRGANVAVSNGDDDDDDSDDDDDEDPVPVIHNSQFYETDSSQEEEEEEDDGDEEDGRAFSKNKIHQEELRRSSTSSSKHSNSRKSQTSVPVTRRPSLNFMNRIHSQGTDITDQREESRSQTSEERSSAAGGLKGILRKMSLAPSLSDDERDDAFPTGDIPSASETFLGRVLSIQNSSGLGLSGGGLAPGASRRENTLRNIDEESEIGAEDEDGIELKRMDFAKLSAEAHNLISVHVPEAHNMLRQFHSGSSNELDEKDTEKEHDDKSHSNEISPHTEGGGEGQREGEREDRDGFFTPNPDYFIRGEAQGHDSDDYMLLDEEGVDGYVAPPRKVQAGVLSSLLKLYQNPHEAKSSSTFTNTTLAEDQDEYASEANSVYPPASMNSSAASKFRSGFRKGQHKMENTFHHIPGVKRKNRNISNSSNEVGDISVNGAQDDDDDDDEDYGDNQMEGEGGNLPSFQNAKPKNPRKTTNVKVPKFHKKSKNKLAQQLRITVHIADFLQRQRFILRMCKALMLFGAPTHRLEEYMTMTSRVLEIDGQFMYFPGCMIVAFGDATTRTSEVHLIRCAQGLNLSKLSDTHKIYKDVIHDMAGVEESAVKLEELLKRKNLYNPWICVFLYGLGSSMVAPFAFGAGWYDIPICFLVGLCVGYLQYFVSSKSNLYSSVFEVSASIVVSFIARGLGSIAGGSGDLFCFGAIAQGSLALILPGYIILCGSLELQSRNLVAGAVRMFYAIIYSLFLGFGITLGAALYGWVDKNSTSVSICPTGHNMDPKWRILFIPMYSMCLGLINQARWRQLPVQIFISSCGYLATYFAGKHFLNVTEFTAAIGAFIVGILGNMYSRIWKGMAVSAMLPAIFVQVPSGIASQSTLLTGIATANQITNSTASSASQETSNSTNTLLFGATMVEVSIGISVGLFAAALVVYPFGKKRTGLFTL